MEATAGGSDLQRAIARLHPDHLEVTVEHLDRSGEMFSDVVRRLSSGAWIAMVRLTDASPSCTTICM